MRRAGGLIAIVVFGAGCFGADSHHPPLSASEAVARARADGFVRPGLDPRPPTYLCSGHEFDLGSTTSGRYAGYKRPTYALEFDDRRVPVAAGNVARIAMRITVFRDAATAARCAEAALYLDMHPSSLSGSARLPHRTVDSTTVVIDEHEPGRPGDAFRDDTGEYDTFISNGRVFAQGLSYNERHLQIVREDLERLAAEIAG